MAKLEYTFKNDTLFKMLFVQHPHLLRSCLVSRIRTKPKAREAISRMDHAVSCPFPSLFSHFLYRIHLNYGDTKQLLKHLVATLLDIPLESIGQFVITNPDIPPDTKGEKFCRLDINMAVNGQRVALEVQVENKGDYPDRILYYWARAYSAALTEGGKYKDLPRTVIISILDFIQFAESPEFHSEFRPLEVTRRELLSDKMSLHFFELRKLPGEEIENGNNLLLWLSLFKANTEEELERIKAMKEPVMEQAISAYEKITVTPEFQEMERLRSRARHNEASALYNAQQKEREKWQGVVADKDEELERLRAELAAIKAKG